MVLPALYLVLDECVQRYSSSARADVTFPHETHGRSCLLFTTTVPPNCIRQRLSIKLITSCDYDDGRPTFGVDG